MELESGDNKYQLLLLLCCCAVVRTAFQYQLPGLLWGRPAVLWRMMVKYLAASNLIQTKLCLLFT